MMVDLIEMPVKYVSEIVLSFHQAEEFNPQNEGFILMLEWIVYPLMLIAAYFPAMVNVMILPTLIVIWMMDPSIFIEWSNKETGQNWPKEGYPTAIAKEFLLLGLLWGDYTYLLDENDLHISLALMIFMLL